MNLDRIKFLASLEIHRLLCKLGKHQFDGTYSTDFSDGVIKTHKLCYWCYKELEEI